MLRAVDLASVGGDASSARFVLDGAWTVDWRRGFWEEDGSGASSGCELCCSK